jgi:hypothetical protein
MKKRDITWQKQTRERITCDSVEHKKIPIRRSEVCKDSEHLVTLTAVRVNARLLLNLRV